MDQVPFPGPPVLFHVRINFLFIILWSLDFVMLAFAVDSTLTNGVGGTVLFASEVSAINFMSSGMLIVLGSMLSSWLLLWIRCADTFYPRWKCIARAHAAASTLPLGRIRFHVLPWESQSYMLPISNGLRAWSCSLRSAKIIFFAHRQYPWVLTHGFFPTKKARLGWNSVGFMREMNINPNISQHPLKFHWFWVVYVCTCYISTNKHISSQN